MLHLLRGLLLACGLNSRRIVGHVLRQRGTRSRPQIAQKRRTTDSESEYLAEPGDQGQCRADASGGCADGSPHETADKFSHVLPETHGLRLGAGQENDGLLRDVMLDELFHGLFRTLPRVEDADSSFHKQPPSRG